MCQESIDDIKPLKMYFFVHSSLSPIQKGIQAGHAAVEYMKKFGAKEITKEWAENHKTFILLDGGTLPNLLRIGEFIDNRSIDHCSFEEPDLGWMTTVIAFIAKDGSDIELFTKGFKLA